MAITLIFIDILVVGMLLFFYLRKKLPLPHKNLFIIISIMLMIAAIFLIFQQEKTIIESRNRLDWPTTYAVIVESKVIGNRAYRPDIIYAYEVEGRSYQRETNLNTPGFGNKRSRRDTAQRIISDYEENQKILIYYNPEDPAESYIRPGPQWSDYMKFGVGHLLFIIALFAFAGNIYDRVFKIKSKEYN